ncbi:hypothetical protein H5410_057184 [Solanum commersonii]|uniref:Uncharacterized protein n=1 Tax=Solanum commersonii TaxID=4109 RepID=A0A9J5WNC8_SOLCO|nr:hypothetical protein H5410_057184 [Solanum commersonii]
MQVQAQPKCSNALTQGMISYSHNGSQFKASKSDATLTLTKKNTMHNFTHRFTRIFQSTFVSAHSRSKGLFKACNGAECKFGYSTNHNWIKKGYDFIKFLPKKGKAQGVFKSGSHTHKDLSCMVQSKLITLDIDTTIKQDSTLSLMIIIRDSIRY